MKTPIVATPIQDVQLLDYVVAHETINESQNYLAGTETEDIYTGLFDEDPYTSREQRQRDQYELDNENWNEVIFEEVLGSSTAKMALHSDWIAQKRYDVHEVVHLELPEQGISGSFLITSIKHILPQKRPVDENPDDSYDFSLVTAIFTHQSNQVYEVRFDNGETLGVTYQHPIYSLTYGDWRLAGELEVGEEVLTKTGRAFVAHSEQKAGSEVVYNLEVKEVHNFLVGDAGVVVHNICWNEIDNFFNMSLTDKRKIISDAYDAWYPQIFARRSFLEGVMRKTKFKDWNHTFDLSKNYKAIDFYRNVGGNNIVSSMKTTKLEDVGSWISQNTSHLEDLVNGKNLTKFDWGSHSIPADIVQLNLFTKKGLSAAEKVAWKNAIETHTGGKIQVIIEVIEESL